ncbi:S1 RNA-binding domain-containing protein [Pantoea sp. 3_1284]|uniref:S1 RNA-binding domain-containing protein n=1 Tax=Pantoea sp. 3_1284 TaxID=2259618 RepID=UPI000DE3A961|nr:S1 RNA-binding domain-containing protein [Pantoea sp. 3_1284]RBO11945.1 RNA-binding protein [Pantoea sp. 3_1284]
MAEMKTSMTSILSAYEQQEKRRALGGIYALAGFDYQLRFYLADFVESLINSAKNPHSAGQVFLEALSDVTRQSADNHLICIQVKRTLTTETIKDAAFEVAAIERFMNNLYPAMCKQVKFNLIASQGSPGIDWSGIPKTHETYATISKLLAQGRLLTPRIEPDPWWRAITATWPHIKDPYGFLRFALERAISRGPTAADAQRIRDDICERFKQEKLVNELSGQLLTSADFQLKAHPSAHLDVGREITLARLRDSQYLGLTQRLNDLCTYLFEYKDSSQRKYRNEVPVFWLTGRSGAGKSVQLLQTLERLVYEGWRVLWLKGNAELLEPALRAIKEANEQDRPDFIAIDDLYDRDARNLIDLSKLGKFIDESDHHNWPIVLTCGPTEFADSFEEDVIYRGFNLKRYPISPLAAQEAEEIEVWYKQRTGKTAQRGSAYIQAAEEDNGLFISLALELAYGDIKTFAQRFAQRIELNVLNKALLLPLALNRLYLRAPYDWLTIEDRETLATLNHEGDFNLLETADEGKIIRLTHPHLANALYLALRKPANKEAYTNDLANVFQRALTEQNAGLLSQLLRLFSGREQGIAIERLSIVKLPDLAVKCARLWRENPYKIPNTDGLADMLTSWACWATTAPNLISELDTDVLPAALESLGEAYKIWSICWQHLSICYPSNEKLFHWAVVHLSDQKFISHPTWSFVWEYCLKNDPSRTKAWLDMGLDWLQRSLRRPDWHIVWKKLLAEDKPHEEQSPILILGHRRLHAESDGPDWAFVLQDLLRLAEPGSSTAYKLFDLAHTWLERQEERDEWTFLWRALLDQRGVLPPTLPLSKLLERGEAWLTGREERDEWTFVWRALLDQRDVLPESLPRSGLLDRGAIWLNERENDAEAWSFVLERLLEQRYLDGLFLDIAAKWLTQTSKKPEWPILSAKFIVASPQHTASKKLAVMLAERIQAEPNNHLWIKTKNLTASLATEEALPQEVKGWLLALDTRKEHPSWAEARRSLNEGLPLKGRIIVKKNSSHQIIELKNGLRAFCSDSGLATNRTYDFYVLNLDLQKDKIYLGINKKVQLTIGKRYKGLIVKYKEYGAFVIIEGQSGLLHKKECSNWVDLVKRFPKGSQIWVKILEITSEGPKLQYAGPELASEFTETLTVGDVYKGRIKNMKEYGLFLRLGTRDGLLHRSQMPPNTNIMQKYSIGEELNVQLIEIKEDGKLTFKLPS